MKNQLLVFSAFLFAAIHLQAQNVGIGTNSPTTKLHVAGAIASTPNTAAAAASVTIPDNTSIFRLSATAGTQANALSMLTPTDGQFLTIYNEDGDVATFASQTIAASGGVASFQYINLGWRFISDNATGGGGGSYINNGTSQQTSANYNIDGNGLMSGTGSIATIGTGTASTANGNYQLTMTPNSTNKSGISITATGGSGTNYGLNVSAGSSAFNGILSANSSTGSGLFAVGGVLSATAIVSGYNGYRNGSGLSYGLYGINGTTAGYATNASTWAAFLQGRTVVSSESSPTSPVGTDLEVRNTTTGAGAPATISMRQTTSLATIGNVLTNLNFGDNYITGPQAQIQVLRDAAASSSTDYPTAMTFWTSSDGPSTMNERMRISSNGNVGIGTTASYPLDVNGVVNSATGFKIAGGTPSTATYLKGNGTNFVAGSILAADVPTLNQNTTGSAASFTGSLAGDVTGPQATTTVGKINGVSMAGLATGILKNTTTTGVPSIATSGTDYVAGGTGSSSQVAYFTGTGVINGSNNHTFAVNPAGATALFSTNTSTTTGSAGILGTATGNGNVSGGQGSTTSTTTGASGLGGFANGTTGTTNAIFGQNFSSTGVAVYGVCSPTATGTTFAVYGQNTGTLSGATRVGTYGTASGGSYNVALYDGGGEVVIANSTTTSTTATLPRGFAGSIFTQLASATTTGGRIWYSTGGYNFYVNSTGSADYSEYFYATDQTLAVGEVVALDPDHANGVRRARPSDAGKTVGIVSIAGSRNNDTGNGNRADDPNYANVGMIGQVPVLISLENGNINPGDALTVSTKYRGRAAKATGSCRIVGYATTHFPYVAGEKDYETDIVGGASMRLQNDHVMCYLNVGWYAPTSASAGEGEELPVTETAHAMMARINTTIVPPFKAEQDARAASIQKQADLRAATLPAQAQPVQAAVKK